jgi:hypothetical protein
MSQIPFFGVQDATSNRDDAIQSRYSLRPYHKAVCLLKGEGTLHSCRSQLDHHPCFVVCILCNVWQSRFLDLVGLIGLSAVPGTTPSVSRPCRYSLYSCKSQSQSISFISDPRDLEALSEGLCFMMSRVMSLSYVGPTTVRCQLVTEDGGLLHPRTVSRALSDRLSAEFMRLTSVWYPAYP